MERRYLARDDRVRLFKAERMCTKDQGGNQLGMFAERAEG